MTLYRVIFWRGWKPREKGWGRERLLSRDRAAAPVTISLILCGGSWSQGRLEPGARSQLLPSPHGPVASAALKCSCAPEPSAAPRRSPGFVRSLWSGLALCILPSSRSGSAGSVLDEPGVSGERPRSEPSSVSCRCAGAGHPWVGRGHLGGPKGNCIQGFISHISGEFSVLPPTCFAKGRCTEPRCLQSLILCSALTRRSWNRLPPL